MKEEILKSGPYSNAKVGDIVVVTKHLSRLGKCQFKAIIHGYVPKGELGKGKFKVKILEMLEPQVVNVNKVRKLKVKHE